jgi:hypothetical protein
MEAYFKACRDKSDPPSFCKRPMGRCRFVMVKDKQWHDIEEKLR